MAFSNGVRSRSSSIDANEPKVPNSKKDTNVTLRKRDYRFIKIVCGMRLFAFITELLGGTAKSEITLLQDVVSS